jgi:hypothetical protein
MLFKILLKESSILKQVIHILKPYFIEEIVIDKLNNIQSQLQTYLKHVILLKMMHQHRII